MNWLLGAGGGGGQRPPNPLIAGSGKWLSIFVAGYAAVFWTPDAWRASEGMIVDAINARYDGMAAEAIYWGLKVAAYPLMFFGVRMALGLIFVSLVLGIVTKVFGGTK